MYKKSIILLSIAFFSLQTILSAQNQNSNADTTLSYLKKKAVELLRPHSNMTFSFSTSELKNEVPDLKVVVPNLGDTIKYVDELKGTYEDWNTFYKIGMLYQRFNMEKQAFDYYTSAYNLIAAQIKQDSLNSKYFADMGELYQSINNGQYAFAYYKMAYELNPEDTSAINVLPMYFINSGDSESAKLIIDKQLKKDSKHINSYIWDVTMNILGEFRKNHKPDELLAKSIDEIFDLQRIKSASEAYKSDPRFPVLYNVSRLFAIFVKYALIADDFKDIKITKNDNAELKKLQKFFTKTVSGKKFKNKYILYKSLGFINILQKNNTKAIENFEKAMNLWPKDELSQDYYILFSTQYFIVSDTLKALEVVNNKIANDKKLYLLNPDDYVLKGNVYLSSQEYTEAKNAYEEAIKFNIKTKDAYLGLAVLEIQDNKLMESNNYINKAYDLDKEYYMSYTLFGIITLMADDKEQAKNALSKAKELKPDDKDIQELYEVFFEK